MDLFDSNIENMPHCSLQSSTSFKHVKDHNTQPAVIEEKAGAYEWMY